MTTFATSVATLAGPASAADPIFLNPSTRPQGAAPAIPYYDPATKVLHDGSKTLTLTGLQGTVVQLHKVDGGYLLGRTTGGTGADMVFVSSTGKRTLITQQWQAPTCDCLRTDVMVDSAGGTVTFNRRSATSFYKDTLTVSLPTLKIIRTRVFSSSARLYEARQGKVLLALGSRLLRWTPKTNAIETVSSIGQEATAADTSAGQQLTRADDGGGSQTLRPLPPATGPTWGVDADENISAWSADNQHIAGSFEIVSGNTDNGFIVRRASDGASTLVVYIPARAKITWEDNNTVLFPTNYDFGNEVQLVRCTLAGDCQRVGPATTSYAMLYVVATRRSN